MHVIGAGGAGWGGEGVRGRGVCTFNSEETETCRRYWAVFHVPAKFTTFLLSVKGPEQAFSVMQMAHTLAQQLPDHIPTVALAFYATVLGVEGSRTSVTNNSEIGVWQIR